MKNHRKPEIFCSLSIYVYDLEHIQALCDHLNAIGVSILEKKTYDKDKAAKIVIAEVDYSEFWHLEEALTVLLNQIKADLSQVRDAAHLYNAGIQIDIAFWQYGTYPSLSIAGNNMRRIRELAAAIDIDAYNGI